MKKSNKLWGLAAVFLILLALAGCSNGNGAGGEGAAVPGGGSAEVQGGAANQGPEQNQAPAAAALGDPAVSYSLKVGQIGTGIKASLVVLAHESGYYEKEGVEVSLENISNLNDGLTAITLGKLDVLPFGVIPSCTFISQGAELVIFGGTIAEGSQCVALPERAAEFKELEGFRGKTVACVRAETGHMIMKGKLREAGIDTDNEVDFVELDGFQSVVEAVSKGTADVGFTNSGFGQNAVKQGLAIVFNVGEYAPDAVCCRQTTGKAVIEEKREALVRFEVANFEAYRLYLEDKEKVIDTLMTYSGQPRDYVEACMYDGVMKISLDPAKNRVAEFYQVMKDNGDIAADTPEQIEEAVDVTIYQDALKIMAERYPDWKALPELEAAFQANNF